VHSEVASQSPPTVDMSCGWASGLSVFCNMDLNLWPFGPNVPQGHVQIMSKILSNILKTQD